MEATKNPSSDGQSIPVLCPMGCGFFGNPTFENYCSQCYRQREQADKANMMREKLESTSPGVVVSSSSAAVAASASSPSSVGAAPQKLLAPATPQAIEQAVTQLLSPTLSSAKPTTGTTLLTATASGSAGSAGGAAAIPEQASDPGVPAIPSAAVKPTPQPGSPSAPALPGVPPADSGRPATTFTTALPAPEPPARPVQKTKSKCFLCRAKIPLAMQITNQCRCEYVFCNSHRHPDQHDCDFEYKTEGRAILAKNNPKLDDHKGGRSFTRLD